MFLYYALKPNIKYMFKDKLCFIFASTIIAFLVNLFFNIHVMYIAPIFWFMVGLSQNKNFKNTYLEK